MKTLNDITIFSMDGTGENTPGILEALHVCLRYFNFSKVLFLTCTPVKDIDQRITQIQIPKLNYYEYNKFCIQNMTDYIETSHCLIIHDDGFIVNPNMWTDDFLKYDYIGAPWYVGVSQGLTWLPQHHNFVGNGGFCIRSKKFMNESKILSEYYTNTENIVPEDLWLCSHNYYYLLDKGIVFADLNTARKFATEAVSDLYPDLSKSFGFHGKFHTRQAYSIVNSRT